MALSAALRKHFWLVPLPLVALAAFCNAQAVSVLVGATLAPEARDLALPPNVVVRPPPPPETSTRGANASTILKRNPFDHVAGPLDAPPRADVDDDAEPIIAIDDPRSAPACEGVNVRAVAASDDEQWSFASIAGADGKSHLLRRGGEIGGKNVYFIGWDRVWFSNSGTLCQAVMYQEKKKAPAAAPTPVAVPAPAASGRGAQPLAADLKRGIQAVSATEYNIDRGVLDKILENQADLMRQARIVPVQENGRVVGVRLNGVKPDALLGVLGMQNGDTLKTINGFDMGDPQKALEAYARLRTANKLTIQLSRGGKNLNLDYNIK